MKKYLCLIFLIFPLFSYSNEHNCNSEYIDNIDSFDIVKMSDQQVIKLGECIAKVRLDEFNSISDIKDSCNEVLEYELNPASVFSTTDSELISIGICTGTIEYIKNNKRYNYSNCINNQQSIISLSNLSNNKISISTLNKTICND